MEMATRLKLHEELVSILGSRNVYYQPPESIKLKYPCIIYERNAGNDIYADDLSYLRKRKYKVTLIHTDPDNGLVDTIDNIPYCSMKTTFIIDNLYHYVFDLYR